MHLNILGKRWRVMFVPPHKLTKYLPRPFRFNHLKDGDCDPPHVTSKTIRISNQLEGIALLEALLHESTHAGDPSKSEEWVTQFANAQARLLWRCGFRRTTDEDE